ncbi:MAG: tetraacyldisaccharide 4'-kinase [Alphaproteobacteria bacterium]
MLQTPEFWKEKGFIPLMLSPLSGLYRFCARMRYRTIKPTRLSVPVICVGNIVVGGSGKTPTCLALADILKTLKVDFHFLSRGYGRETNHQILRVDLQKHHVKDVGDEPLLLVEKAPCWVARDRVAGGLLAIENGAKAIVMDDGFQNPSLEKDISLLVLDAGYGIGNGKILPAGPLRETLLEGVARADAVILIGDDTTGIATLLKKEASTIPVFSARLKVKAQDKKEFKGQSVFAFAGIARPDKFYNSLAEIGAHVVDTKNFPDHHYFTDADLVELMRQASTYQASLVTTTKDFVRLPAEMRDNVSVLPVELVWKNKQDLKAFLKEKISHA